jgi:hypothetical protein
MPADIRDRCLQLLVPMGKSFNSKTNYTWKPYVIALMRAIGVNQDELDSLKYPGSGRVTPENLRHAEQTADSLASSGEAKFLDDKTPPSLGGTLGETEGRARWIPKGA